MSKKKKSLLEFNTDYTFDDEMMEIFDIPKIKLIDKHEEIWRCAIFDRHPKSTLMKRYLISNYGRLYDFKEGKIVKSYESDFFKSSISSYIVVKLKLPKDKEDGKDVSSPYLMHRLVALAFLKQVEGKKYANHKDGNPSHNYLWNLEWCSNSENYIHAIRTGLKIEKHGEDRTHSLWTNNEIRIICKMMEDGHKATFIYNALKEILPNDDRVQYERIRTLYKHIIHKTHWEFISKEFDIDFSSFNYKKEKGSVKSVLLKKGNKK